MAIPMPQRATPQQDAFARAVSSRVAGGQLRNKGPPLVKFYYWINIYLIFFLAYKLLF